MQTCICGWRCNRWVFPWPHGAPFGTDGGMLFQKLGVKSLLWGPGSIQNAHQPDEWIELRDLAHIECDLHRLLGRLAV